MEKRFCEKCGNSVNDTYVFCPNCGQKFTNQQCAYLHNEIDLDGIDEYEQRLIKETEKEDVCQSIAAGVMLVLWIMVVKNNWGSRELGEIFIICGFNEDIK